MTSRSRSAWPQCRAYSSTMCTRMSRTLDVSPSRTSTTRSSPASSHAESHASAEAICAFHCVNGVLDHGVVRRGPVEVEVVVVLGAVEALEVQLALQHPLEPRVLDLGHVPHQAQQRQRARRDRSAGQLLGGQAGALHLEGEPEVVEVLAVRRELAHRVAERAGVLAEVGDVDGHPASLATGFAGTDAGAYPGRTGVRAVIGRSCARDEFSAWPGRAMRHMRPSGYVPFGDKSVTRTARVTSIVDSSPRGHRGRSATSRGPSPSRRDDARRHLPFMPRKRVGVDRSQGRLAGPGPA